MSLPSNPLFRLPVTIHSRGRKKCGPVCQFFPNSLQGGQNLRTPVSNNKKISNLNTHHIFILLVITLHHQLPIGDWFRSLGQYQFGIANCSSSYKNYLQILPKLIINEILIDLAGKLLPTSPYFTYTNNILTAFYINKIFTDLLLIYALRKTCNV